MSSHEAFEKAADGAMEMITSGFRNLPELDEKSITDYGSIKRHLILQMISAHDNAEKLQSIPRRVTGDIALVVRFETQFPDGHTGTAVITNDMVRSYGITPEQLFDDALEAAPKNEPARLATNGRNDVGDDGI